ncbi:hypothetical protein ACFQ7I_05630 [Streptomyces massasporeus]
MCQCISVDGYPHDWHPVDLGSPARGGSGLVMQATAVEPEGRITPSDAGIQISHAGRKASTAPPWEGDVYVEPEAGEGHAAAPSPLPSGDWPAPRELGADDIRALVRAFGEAAARALSGGFEAQ